MALNSSNVFSPNSAIDAAIREMLPHFSETSQHGMSIHPRFDVPRPCVFNSRFNYRVACGTSGAGRERSFSRIRGTEDIGYREKP